MTRTPTLPADDPKTWRRLTARTHPDAGGDHELFIWADSLREHVLYGFADVTHASPRGAESPRSSEAARVPYDATLGAQDEFATLTLRAVSVGQHTEEPYRSLLALLIDCPADDRGRAAARQERGATYRQLGRIAYEAGMAPGQRPRWYDLARSIPLAEKHASHLIDRISGRSAA